MTETLEGLGDRLSSASPASVWPIEYARGSYTDVVRGWIESRGSVAARDALAVPEVAEAVAWSLALTKATDSLPLFRDDLAGLVHGGPILAVLESWHAVHEARYDAALHAARSARAQALASGGSVRVLAQALKVEGVALHRLARYGEAEAATRQALDLFQLAGDALAVSHCATNLGLVQNAKGDLVAARAASRQAVDSLVAIGAAEERVALARVNLAIVELHLGQVDAARDLFASSRASFLRLGLRSEEVTALNGLGHCERALARHDAAAACHEQALRLAGTDLPRQVGLCHEFLGRVHFERGDTARAARHYRRALEMAAHIAPDGDLMLEVCWHWAEFLAATGRVSEAIEYVERAETLCRESGERRELGCVQRARARCLAAQGDGRAAAAFDTAFATLVEVGRTLEAALTLVAHAEAEAQAPDHARALYAQARSLLVERLPASGWIARIDRALEAARQRPSGRTSDAGHGFVTRDPELEALLEDLPALAATPYPVLIEGESGTGKELLARAIHAAGARSGPWVALNCAAVPRDLFESELFGHVRGAFSGALLEKPGLFEQAAGGTLFLDEIGDMPLELQAKLLRVLDDGQVRRVGDVRTRHVDVKVIAATNRPLDRGVAEGSFRLDLFHRLAVHTFVVKPLRDRPMDIELLARHLLEREGLESALQLTPELVAHLETRSWPGNARELRNFLVRAATQRSVLAAIGLPTGGGSPSLRAARSTHERRMIEAALTASNGNLTGAARTLRLHVTTLRRKMRALGVQRPD
jgi:transcriptional regulator with GAF, ATPase, and Fis domain